MILKVTKNRFTAHFYKQINNMENGNSMVMSNGETKQPFLIGVAGGTASGKVCRILSFCFFHFANRKKAVKSQKWPCLVCSGEGLPDTRSLSVSSDIAYIQCKVTLHHHV